LVLAEHLRNTITRSSEVQSVSQHWITCQ